MSINRSSQEPSYKDHDKKDFGSSSKYAMFSQYKEDRNKYNIIDQIWSLQKTLDLLRDIGFDSDEVYKFVELAKSVMNEYLGYTRSTEKLPNGLAAPTFLHFIYTIQIICQIYLFIKNPKRYHNYGIENIYKEHAIRINKFIAVFEKNKFEIIIAALFHDAPEDLMFLFDNFDSKVDERHFIEESILSGKKKNLQIKNNKYFNDEVLTCTFNDIVSEAYNFNKNYTIKNAYEDNTLDLLESMKLFTALIEYRRALELDPTLELDEYCKNKNPHEANMFKRDVFIGLSNYHILFRLVKNGINIKTSLSILKLIDNVTFRKIADIKLTNKDGLLHLVHEDIHTAWVKIGDVLHNISSISNLDEYKKNSSQPKQLDKQNRNSILVQKYSDYMETIDAVGPFLFSLYPAVVAELKLPLDPLVEVKMQEFQERKKYIVKSRRGQQPLFVTHNEVISNDKVWNRITNEALTQVGYSGQDDKKAQVLMNKLNELMYDQQSIHYDRYLDEMFTIVDLFNGEKLYEQGHEKKSLPGEFIYKVIVGFVGKRNIVESDSIYGFEITPKGLEKINYLLNQAFIFYTKDLYGHIPESYLKNARFDKMVDGKYFFSISNTKTLFDFLRSANSIRSGWVRQTTCSLLKLAYQNILFQGSDVINQQDKNFAHTISTQLLPLLRTDDHRNEEFEQLNKELKKGLFASQQVGYREYFLSVENKLVDGSVSTEDNLVLDKLDIIGKKYGEDEELKLMTQSNVTVQNVYLRSKSGESARYKQLSDPQYGKLELIRDYSGIRLEVKNKEEAIALLQYMYFFFFNENIHTIKTKGLIKYDELEQYKNILTDRFYKIFQIYLRANESTQRERKSNPNFKDITISGTTKGKYASKTEIQIVLSNNSNENNFSHHAVFTGAKIIESMVRLEGYVNTEYIRHVAKMQILKHPELKGLGSPPGLPSAVDRLLNYYIDQILIEIRHQSKKGSESRFYTTPNRWNCLKHNGFLQGVQTKYYATKDRKYKWSDTVLPGRGRKEYIKVTRKLLDNIELFDIDAQKIHGLFVNAHISKTIQEVRAILIEIEEPKNIAYREWKEKKNIVDKRLFDLLSEISKKGGKKFSKVDIKIPK